MSAQNDSPSKSPDREILLSRTFDAPRELVWQAMTDPKHVVHWWGPRGFTTTTETMDVRPGGVWKHVMRGPDGVNYPNKSIFQEVVKPERIVYSHGGGREGGPGASFVATWTFEALALKKTRLTVRMVFPTSDGRDLVVREFGAIEGGRQTLARLAEHLPRMAAAAGDFVIARVVDAPRDLVWKLWTEAKHLKEWFGPKGLTTPVATMDFRVGGKFHYCMQTPDGGKMWGRFVYREIVAPERLVWVNSFSDEQGGLARVPFSEAWPTEMLNTVTFAEAAEQTLVTITTRALNATPEEQKTFDTNHDNMTQGWGGTLDKLTAYTSRMAENL